MAMTDVKIERGMRVRADVRRAAASVRSGEVVALVECAIKIEEEQYYQICWGEPGEMGHAMVRQDEILEVIHGN